MILVFLVFLVSFAMKENCCYFQAKMHLILEYDINLAFLALLKAEGKPLLNHPVVGLFIGVSLHFLNPSSFLAGSTERLIFLRSVIEKVRPLESKLKYQMDKVCWAQILPSFCRLISSFQLVKSASLGVSQASENPLSFKPNHGKLVSKVHCNIFANK